MPKNSSGSREFVCGRLSHPVWLIRPTLVGLVAIATATAGCSLFRPEAPAASASATMPAPDRSARAASAPESAADRHVGDYFVHMISGSFRKQPATLTERVTGHEGDTWIIEYTLEDANGSRGVRTYIDENGEVGRVVCLSGGTEQAGTIADYDALMASTSVVPDENVGLAATTRGTCTVGPAELDCETKSYRVRLGDKEANLGITASAALPGRDLAGEITAADGTVIFRSELIEQGTEAPSRDGVALLSGK